MSAVRTRLLLLTLFATLFVGRSPPSDEHGTNSAQPRKPGLDTQSAAATLAKMPVRFEANAGQHDGAIRFVARRGTASLVLRDDGATFMIQQRTGPKRRGEMERRANRVVIGLKVDGGRTVAPQANEELVTKSNYFVGNDPAKWRTDVPNYAKVTYPSVLDGVDLVYHGENGALEYDFVVAPGTNVDRVAMNVEGANKMSITEKGELRIHTYAGDIVQPPPVVYQRDAKGAKTTIASSYRLVGRNKVGFEVTAVYDHTKPLVIDPVLGYATYLGGSGYDDVRGIAADAAGNTYITGATYSTDFPTANAYDPTFNVYDGCPSCSYGTDTFIAKLDPTGSQLLYSTFLGGTQSDEPAGIAIGADDTAYVTGTTTSFNFPTVNPINSFRFNRDGFVARLSAEGNTLGYSTYLSGGLDDRPSGIAVDGSGIYIGGTTNSSDLTEAPNNLRPAPEAPNGFVDDNAFVVKLTPFGDEVMYVQYLGGTANERTTGLAIDGMGHAYITGETYSGDFPHGALKPACQGNEQADAFVARVNETGTQFDYATCFGGGATDRAQAIAVDTNGSAYVTGETVSNDFPTQGTIYPYAGSADVFVAKLNPEGTALVYSTFIGGSSDDNAYGIAVDSSNTAWITGTTNSSDYPTVIPIQPTFAGGGSKGGGDAFVSRVNAAGSALIFSTFYGGGTEFDEGVAIAVNGSSIHLGGNTYSTDLPLFNARQQTNAGGQDGFVARITVPPLLISPPTVAVPVGSTRQFTAVGGAGFGYVFSFQTNGSGGSISAAGAYSAGVNGGTTDVVLVTDGAGLTATATVQVGPNTTALVISPTNTNTPPKGQRVFTASGGVPPYVFGFGSNASGATITPSGVYTAGPTGGVTDVVRVTDTTGASAQATVIVGASIKITPEKPATPPNGSVSFAATGGSGAGYTWSILTNGSGGQIGSTGHYTAGSGSNTVDTVQVTDSLGNKASVNVSVGGGLAITPADPTTSTRGAIAFTAVGGSGVYTWSLTAAPSGATIDANSGAYVAGTTGNTIDTVRVQDSVGNASAVQVTVGPSLTITPSTGSVLAGATLAFSAAGGSGAGYTFALVTNESGGTIGADGIYTAGTTGGVDLVRLTDSLGNTDEASVTVTAAPPSNNFPDGGTPGFDAGTIPGLNIGGGGVNEDCTCRAVGGSSANAPGTAAGLTALSLMLGLVVRRRRRD
jgi:hypothetical protein